MYRKLTKKQIKELSDQGITYVFEKKSKNIHNKFDSFLRNKYNLTHDQYIELLKIQNYVCAICGGVTKDKRLSVDHCHSTLWVRGLLCQSCNLGLGNFRDNPESLRRAADYLESFLSRKKTFVI